MINNDDKLHIILERVLIFVFIVYSIFLLFNVTISKDPIIAGDGYEYLGMTISFFNHRSPDLREEDIILRSRILNKNEINVPEDFYYHGYYPSLNGALYSYHFWAYSLINLPVFSFLYLFNLNELRCFQITNSLLLISCIWIIIYRFKSDSMLQRVWFSLFVAFSPVLFYVQWPHPEVLSYTFVVIAIVFATRQDYILSVLMTSIASLQNPPILVLISYFLFLGWKYYDREKFIYTFSTSFISAIPFVFYYLKYNEFSLIAAQGLASISYISVVKILSLFLDLNYGLILYVPLILTLSLFAILTSTLKKDFFIIELWIVLILMATLASAAADLSSGIMYIHRYGVWLIPIVIFVSIYSISYYSERNINAYLLVALIIGMSITGYCLNEYDSTNYLRLNSLSETVLICAPGLYNPPKQVFVDRSLEREFSFNDWFETLPVIYMYDGIPRKVLKFREQLNDSNSNLKETYHYINEGDTYYINSDFRLFKLPLNKNEIRVFMNPSKNDIAQDFLLDRNWHIVEIWHSTPTRWMANEASLLLYSNENRPASLSLQALSFYRPRTLEIYVNDQPSVRANVSAEDFEMINVTLSLNKGTNILTLRVPEGSESPSNIPEMTSHDVRYLSLAIQNINIK